MFRGLTRTLVIVTAAMVVLPAAVLAVSGGSEWMDKFGMMNPFF
ncbi:hypothetical protein ACSBLW_02190 [Thioclava sp. FR2]